MSLPMLSLTVLVLLVTAYLTYGRYVARQFGVDDTRPTPAHTKGDGVDYVATNPFYLFGQHFSAIAAAGPIAGPIAACLAFGWLPSLLWICLGVVFIGAVHDFSSLLASVRHGGCSMAEVTRVQLGSSSGRAMMLFIWIALVYVIVAFVDITAASFSTATEELRAIQTAFHPGGAVAASATLYLILALALGVLQRFFNPPLFLVTLIAVPLLGGVVWAGTYLADYLVFSTKTWALLILLYCAVASVLPVWLLLQPRGYLGGFVLYFALAVGTAGILFGGHEIAQPAFRGWEGSSNSGPLLPFLFVTIACGACSGFHGLVCSGTTSKQIDREAHAHPIGYGAMLAEGFVALIALAVVMIAVPASIAGLKPGTIYGNGMGEFLTLFIGRENLPFAITFGAMAFSTFVFDTVDVAARLGRYLVQELTGLKGASGAAIGTALTLGVPAALLLSSDGQAWSRFWVLFGASNQLLAALTLLSISIWLINSKRSPAITLVPMCFVLTITVWTLGTLFVTNVRATAGMDAALVNAVASFLLIVLALYLVFRAAVCALPYFFGSTEQSEETILEVPLEEVSDA